MSFAPERIICSMTVVGRLAASEKEEVAWGRGGAIWLRFIWETHVYIISPVNMMSVVWISVNGLSQNEHDSTNRKDDNVIALRVEFSTGFSSSRAVGQLSALKLVNDDGRMRNIMTCLFPVLCTHGGLYPRTSSPPRLNECFN